ncbi:cytidine deaminase-like protein [Polychaeton citri CBS 116435]|uniref:tRNA(adenine(34)) deaminase n=1 Tax=Polychaeton citri CBS 116435 TaxID=1314669 RepID=A0A9P4Q9I2_9PEZI|nr:cytidine deaminase-like protein [Polychaeton citri CBS 116435]
MPAMLGLRVGGHDGNGNGNGNGNVGGAAAASGSQGIMTQVLDALRWGRCAFLSCLHGALFATGRVCAWLMRPVALAFAALFGGRIHSGDGRRRRASTSASASISTSRKDREGVSGCESADDNDSNNDNDNDYSGNSTDDDRVDRMSTNAAAVMSVFRPVPNREVHEGWMREAINMAELALRSDETPVGCVFVRKGEIIGRGINGTNASLNGTRHAEFVALAEIMAKHPPSVLQETDLYVTVEPCIMCASALRQFRIRAVYFGCLNDRFGGCGGVMTVHDDKSVDPGFPAFGGIFREEAIMLLRRFYVQENEKAPEPKPKKNRELKTEILPVNVTRSTGLTPVATPGAGTPVAETPT